MKTSCCWLRFANSDTLLNAPDVFQSGKVDLPASSGRDRGRCDTARPRSGALAAPWRRSVLCSSPRCPTQPCRVPHACDSSVCPVTVGAAASERRGPHQTLDATHFCSDSWGGQYLTGTAALCRELELQNQ